jgi:hypothetical protein
LVVDGVLELLGILNLLATYDELRLHLAKPLLQMLLLSFFLLKHKVLLLQRRDGSSPVLLSTPAALFKFHQLAPVNGVMAALRELCT